MGEKVITISGLPGSGTTTVAKMLAERTGMEYFNVGMIFRELAEKYKMDLQSFEVYCEGHPEIDRELDRKQEMKMKQGKIIMEGRLSGWIAYLKKIPSFRIWLDCEEEERMRRVVEREGGEMKDKKKETKERMESEKRRYEKFYGIKLDDKSIYDMIIDTTNTPPEKIVEMILEKMREKGF